MDESQLNNDWAEYQATKQPDINRDWQEYQALISNAPKPLTSQMQAQYGATGGEPTNASKLAPNPNTLSPVRDPSVANSPVGQIKTDDASVDIQKDNYNQTRDSTIQGLEFNDPNTPPTEQSAKDVREIYPSYQTIKNTLGGMRDLYKEKGAELFPMSTAAKTYDTKMGTLTGEIKRLEKLGTLDAGVSEYLRKLITPPVGSDITNINGFIPQVDEYEKYLDTKMSNTLPAYGYKMPAKSPDQQKPQDPLGIR